MLSRQLIRSGAGVGAGIEETTAGPSRMDFAARMVVASKEACKTRYRLRLLRDSGYADPSPADSLILDRSELIKMLTATEKSARSTAMPKHSGGSKVLRVERSEF